MSTSKAFELLHMDLFGPTTYTSIGRNKYGFVIVDDFTIYTWIFFLSDQSVTFATFKSFVKRYNNEFETTIKKVRSDNGSEFRNTRVESFVMSLESNINSRPNTHNNQMALSRGRIEHSLIWQGLCLVSIM